MIPLTVAVRHCSGKRRSIIIIGDQINMGLRHSIQCKKLFSTQFPFKKHNKLFKKSHNSKLQQLRNV